MRIYYDNSVVDSPVSFESDDVASENLNFPRTNIQNTGRTALWKTTGDSGITDEFAQFQVSSGGPSSGPNVRAMLLLNHDIQSDDVFKFQGNNSASWGSPSVDETVTHSTGVMSEILGSVSNYNFWRVVWTKNTATDVYSLGRLFIGDYHETERQPDYTGYNRSRSDRTIKRTAYSGRDYTLARTDPKTFNLIFPAITQTQVDAFETIVETVGTHTPFFFQIDPSGSGDLSAIHYGKFTTLPEYSAASADTEQRYDTTLNIEEAL